MSKQSIIEVVARAIEDSFGQDTAEQAKAVLAAISEMPLDEDNLIKAADAMHAALDERDYDGVCRNPYTYEAEITIRSWLNNAFKTGE